VRHCGIDVHAKTSELCEVSANGKVVRRERMATTQAGLRRRFESAPKTRIVVECGGSTPWVVRLLESFGHEVLVVNPRRVRLIAESTLKCDRIDAEILARLSRLDPELLRPVYQRSYEGQLLRTRLRVRSSLVQARAALINQVRGTLRAHGAPMTSCGTKAFVARFATGQTPQDLRELLEPLVGAIGELTDRIETVERQLVEDSQSDELLERLQEVPGVGPLVSLSFVAWVDRAERFTKSRDAGACLGLRPSLRASGGVSRRGPITREGDTHMRWLLVQAAHAALAVHKDSALKRWGEALVARAGKKRAVVALARKLAVLLHTLWVTGDSYRPFPATA
jgi:transposase